MLDLARIITKSSGGRFDTVYFFDKSAELVLETQKRIPGAIGFPGDLVDTVLLDDDDDDALDSLDAHTEDRDNTETRNDQRRRAMHREFRRSFPFDVLNLDLERYFFRPNDQFPGKLMNALRKLFEWQKRPMLVNGKSREIDSFTLMFTTRVGPSNLGDNYLELMREVLRTNIDGDRELAEIMRQRFGVDDIKKLEESDFPSFFKLAVPKLLVQMLDAKDWYIDEKHGLQVYTFDRPHDNGSYTMLHIVMDVKRKDPPEKRRGPHQDSPTARASYAQAVRSLFVGAEINVTVDSIDEDKLRANLAAIKARRKLYYPECCRRLKIDPLVRVLPIQI